MRKYDLTQAVQWGNVLKCVNFRIRFHYSDFMIRVREIAEELDRKHPNIEKVELWRRFACGQCREAIFWEAVYLELRQFLHMKVVLPNDYDMSGCRAFLAEYDNSIDV